MRVMRRFPVLLAVAALLETTACNAGRHSSSGFRLPDTGDPERGKATFIALGCNNCHWVAGTELPAPTAQPPVPVVLGGEVPTQMTDGHLVTSIINPDYRFANYSKSRLAVNGRSRMAAHPELTVQQLTDIVAFLQSHYTLRSGPPMYSAY